MDETGWDKDVNEHVMKVLLEVDQKLKKNGDPAKGAWPVSPHSPVTVWADASNIALGAALEIDGNIVEDASWLRPKHDSAHINRSELDALGKT